MKAYDLVLAILGVWRITHLLQAEDGPWALVVRLRRAVGEGFWGGLLDCFYCLSVWVAAGFCVGLTGRRRTDPVACLAVSGAACLLEQATRRTGEPHHHTGDEQEESRS